MRSMASFLLLLLLTSPAFARPNEQQTIEAIFGTPENLKFSFHQPTYFVFGDDDLKLQFSFKYRLARSFPIYFAYTQLMFWNIYDESKPFADVNYKPEIFYRLLETDSKSFKTLDMGYLHTSNGRDEDMSRSLDRIFVRGNYLTKFKRHYLDVNLMVFKIFNEDDTNKDIVNHLGYWDLSMMLTDLILIEDQSLDLEFRTYAGSKGYDLDQGATQIGLIYNFGSENFNPSIYLQRFEGYGESLMTYNKRRTEYRLGLLLAF
jgi:phospholipase A1